MKLLKATFLLASAIFFSQGVQAQTVANADAVGSVKASPAYTEVMVRSIELRSELEAALLDYREESPKVRAIRREIAMLDDAMEMLMRLPLGSSGKMTSAVGRLIVRRAALETEYSETVARYGDDHPEVRRAKRRVEVYERSIRELLK